MHTGSFATSSLACCVYFISLLAGIWQRGLQALGGGSQCRTGYTQEVTSDPQRSSESCLPGGLNAAAGSGYDYLSLP